MEELQKVKNLRENPGLLSMPHRNKIRLFSVLLMLGIIMIVFGAFLSIRDAESIKADVEVQKATEVQEEATVQVNQADQQVLSLISGMVANLDKHQKIEGKYPVSTEPKSLIDLKREVAELSPYTDSEMRSYGKDFIYQSDQDGAYYAIYASLSGESPTKGENPPRGFDLPKGYNYFFSNKQ